MRRSCIATPASWKKAWRNASSLITWNWEEETEGASIKVSVAVPNFQEVWGAARINLHNTWFERHYLMKLLYSEWTLCLTFWWLVLSQGVNHLQPHLGSGCQQLTDWYYRHQDIPFFPEQERQRTKTKLASDETAFMIFNSSAYLGEVVATIASFIEWEVRQRLI